jgi:hypothetical protein
MEIIKIPQDLQKDYLVMFSNHAVVCNEQHLRVCPCQDKLVDEVSNKLIEDDEKYKQSNNLDEIQSRMRNDGLRRKAIDYVGKQLSANNTTCPVEQDLISSIIYRFDKNGVGKYNLSDPDVFMILKATINHMLSAHRMQLFSNKHGIVQRLETEQGVRFIINPVESAKLQFDKAMVEAVEKLNKIVYGEKSMSSSMNFNVDVNKDRFVSFKDIHKHLLELNQDKSDNTE